MRLLILGGSWFLGRAIVDAAADHDVTTFRRGRSGPDLPGVRLIRGDRTDLDDLQRLASQGPWDAVIDTSGYVPREVLAAVRALEPVVDRYVFLSTVSVYAGWPVEPLSEESPLLECPSDAGSDFGVDRVPGPTQYGYQKAGAERAVMETFGDGRVAVLRPGVILGPREYVGRLPWWLSRVERGGRVLAPGRPDQPIQPVDVRDVADFALRCAVGQAGVYNLVGSGGDTFGSMLSACRQVTNSAAEFVWITDEDWLAGQGVAQWTELPLWRTYPGTWRVDGSRAVRAGFTARPITDTVADTWAWMSSDEAGVAHERSGEHGMPAEKEAAILGRWLARDTG